MAKLDALALEGVSRLVGGDGVSRFAVRVEVANNEDITLEHAGLLEREKVRRVAVKGVVDSAATRLVLPGSLVKQLGLKALDKVRVRYADRRKGTRARVGNVFLRYKDRSGVFSAIVEPKRKTALIGAMVLEEFDLLIDCTRERLVPRDPRIIVSEIE